MKLPSPHLKALLAPQPLQTPYAQLLISSRGPSAKHSVVRT